MKKQIEMTDLSTYRKDFPILNQEVHGHPLVYLDNAATTQKPTAVIEAIQQYYEKDNSNVHRGIHELSNRATAAYEGARARVARFIHAEKTEEIIFTRGTTEAINLVAQSWSRDHLRSGDRILLTEMEHHSNLVPWQLIAQELGAKVEYVRVEPETGTLDLEDFHAKLKEQNGPVKIFACTHISNTLGTINPVRDLCAQARKAGAVTLIDGAQSAGHAPVNVQEIGCDFFAFSGHKACAPTGIGALYGRLEILEKMRPWQGGGEMISSVTFEKATFKTAPHKFEAGTPNIAGAAGLHAALDYLDGIGRELLAKHDRELAGYAYQKLMQVEGVKILGPREERAGMVSFVLDTAHAHDVVEMTNQYGVALRGGHHCNQPLMKKLKTPATSRASFFLYNTSEEVDRLAEVIAEVRKFFNR